MIEGTFVTIAALGTVFGWAFFSFWSAIPAGVALNLSPLLVAVTTTISYASGAALVALVGAPLRERIRRLMEGRQNKAAARPNRMLRLALLAWERFGLVGLALLAPMTVGAQVGAVIGLSFGARPLRLILALTAGAALWSALITLAISTGLAAIRI